MKKLNPAGILFPNATPLTRTEMRKVIAGMAVPECPSECNYTSECPFGETCDTVFCAP
jgi:hypothetical protein